MRRKVLVSISGGVFSLRRIQLWVYTSWFEFLIRYRKTMLGPLWLLVGPALFISLLGLLYAHVGGIPVEKFIPHLTIGIVVWTLITGFLVGSTRVFQKAQAQIMQDGIDLIDIVMVSVLSTVIHFAHQVVLIIVVLAFFKVPITPYALVSLVGLVLLIINGIWLTIVFGIIGARFRDLAEIVQAIMRIAFLATPVIWMPSKTGRGGVMGAFLDFNPFYHFLELIRAPLLGTPIEPLSWILVLSITVTGFLLAYISTRLLAKNIALWV